MIPSIILLDKNKIYGKTKKGLLIYKAIDLITNNKYYVPTSIKKSYNIYALIKPTTITNSKYFATLEIPLFIDNLNKGIESALLYKYNLYNKNNKNNKNFIDNKNHIYNKNIIK